MNTPSSCEHLDDAVDDGVHVLDMGEAIGRGDDAGRSVQAIDLARRLLAEIALDGRDAALVGDVADIGRLDAEHAIAGVLEVRYQRAVIGADIDNEIVRAQPQHGGGSRAAGRRNCRAVVWWCRWCKDIPAGK